MRLTDLLFESDRPRDEVFVYAGDVERTRAQLEGAADALASTLRASGVEPGQPVAVLLPSCPAVVAALFGVWRAGAVYVPLNPRLTDAEIAHALDEVRAAVVVTTAEHERRAGDIAVVVAVDDGTWRPPVDDARAAPGAATHDDDIAAISFTSGTTGRPKPVPLRHSGVAAMLDGVIRTLRPAATPDDPHDTPPRRPMPNLVPVSLALWSGVYQVLFAFRVGAPVIVMAAFEPVEFARLVRRFEVRSTVLPPAAMTMLVDDARVTDLDPLRYVRSITAPLSPLQARRFKDKFGIAVLNGYGQTELGGEIVGWSAADSRAYGDTKLGAVGRPHRGVIVRPVDRDGADVGPDEAGELWVQTPAIGAGSGSGGALSDRVVDGWFRTGDVGRIDPDGFVWIEGRVSDMINRGGLKVFPAEVAEVLLLSPDVADAAVVGVPDDRLGEVPCAFVVPADPDVGIEPEALERLCREHLAPYKVPVRFDVVDALPCNEIGKVLAVELVARAIDATRRGAASGQ